jgi:hypothetical protein
MLYFHIILWTHEEYYMREGVFSVHNSYLWTRYNLLCIHELEHQVHFNVSFQAGIAGDIIVDPYLVPARLNAERCRDFLSYL